MSSGQPSVENGHSPEENQVSRTSSSCVQPAGGSSSGPRQTTSPAGPYQTGMRWPHHSWREMHQSYMLSTQANQRGSSSFGWTTTRPSRTASPAAFASGPTLTNHCIDSRGSIGSCGARWLWPTLCRYGRFSATIRPCARSASRTATRASNRSMPSNSVPVPVMTPLSSMIDGIGRPCRRPISKSFGSCAGVTLTAPVPNAGSTWSSARIGMRRPTSGSSISRPTRCR